MLGSLLSLLTASAALLLLPASVGLLATGQHAHKAEVDQAARRSRLALAVTSVGLGSAGTTFALGGRPLVASAVAGLLAGSVLAWSRGSRSWAVRGVVAWALLSATAAGGIGWLAHHVLSGSPGLGELLVGASAWLVLLLAAVRLLGRARVWVARRAVREGGVRGAQGAGGAAPWLVTSVVMCGLAAAVGVGGAPGAGDRPAPVADSSSAGGTNREGPGEGRTDTGPSAPAHPARSAAPDLSPAESPSGGALSGEDAPKTDSAPLSPEAPAVTTEPASSPEPAEEPRTPGYEKYKPNRPEDAPSPGSGRPKRP